MSLAATLEKGVEKLGIRLPSSAEQRLLDYLALLQKWNRVYSLTAIRDASRSVSHHLLDSLAVVPYLKGGRILDVGSGPGLPGIPVAIARPDWHVTLLDSNHKKAAFLNQAVVELKVTNAEVRRERVEQWSPSVGFEVVISRAFSELADFVRLAGHLLAPDGRLAAMKGLYPYEEIAQMPDGYRVDRVVPLTVPGVEGERHLVMIEKSTG